MALKWLTGSVTQGGADAFAEAELQTGLSNVTRTAYRIRVIEWYMPALASADSQIQLQLSRRSVASVNTLLASVIAALIKKVELTTSGSPVYEVFPNRQMYDRDMELLIVEETLYLDIDSDTTGAANLGAIRIGYETRSITENERLAIQASTANA